jgi:hypothetical protein
MAKFQPGVSGNKAGRPRGVPDRRAQARALFDQHVDALIGKAIELALSGEMAALKMCLDRVVPALKQTDAGVALGVMPDSLAAKGERVLGLVAAGTLPTDMGGTLMEMLAKQARIVEVSVLEQRIAALEMQSEGA